MLRCLPSLALGLVLACFASSLFAQGAPQKLVHVSGSHTVSVAPDQVDIEVTITTTDDDLLRVRASSDKVASSILAFCKKHGVEDKGFVVSRLELSLDFNEQLKRQIYTVERDVTISLSDLSRLDAVLSDLLKETSTKVAGVSYATSKSRQYELQALRGAAADAQERAKLLAELHDLKLGKAQDIRVVNQACRPFVTSVVPVVGAAELEHRQLVEGAQVTAIKTSKPQTPTKRFVVLQQPAAGNAPFGLGTLEFSASVQIDYLLVE
jgi:uncharacterized protein YggE